MFDPKQIRVVHYEPTTACQLACPQCARYLADGQYNSDISPTTVTLDEFKKIIPVDFIRQLDKFYMCGTFGEPAANYDTLEIFQYLRSINIAITLGMNTNGGLRHHNWWKNLGQLFCQARDYVVFSIDGLEDTLQIYRKNINWRQLMRNAEFFINAGGSAHWDMIAFEHNEHEIDAARTLARDMGFTWFRVKRSQRHEYRPVTWVNPPKGIAPLPDRSSAIKCEALDKSEVYISAHGNILPCCHIDEQLFADSRPTYREELTTKFGDLAQYHTSNGIDNVLDKFQWIPDTWQSQPLQTCQASCGVRPKTDQWIINEQLR